MTLRDVLRSRLETVGAEAGALVHLESGACLEAIQGGSNKTDTTVQGKESDIGIDTIERDAVATARFVRVLIQQAGDQEDEVEEFVSATPSKYELSHFLRTSTGSKLLLYLRFDAGHMAPALARHRLSGFERQIELTPEDNEWLQSLTLPVAATPAPAIPVETVDSVDNFAVARAKAPAETVRVVASPTEAPTPTVTLATVAPPPTVEMPATEPAPASVEIPSAPLSPSAHALRQRESQIKEEEEYRQMNADSIRWLKEMKKLLSWTRPPARAEPVSE